MCVESLFICGVTVIRFIIVSEHRSLFQDVRTEISTLELSSTESTLGMDPVVNHLHILKYL